jgi:hypothetical protein
MGYLPFGIIIYLYLAVSFTVHVHEFEKDENITFFISKREALKKNQRFFM